MKLRKFLSCTFIFYIAILFVVSICSIQDEQNQVKAETIVVPYSTAKFDSKYYLYRDAKIFDNSYISEYSVLNAYEIDTIEAKRDSLYDKLMIEVHTYIYKYSPCMASKLSKHMLDTALDNEFDLCFMLAQAQKETTFGKYGSGKTRKSVFGVSRRYSSYKKCIDDYVNLVQSKYLGQHKTEQHLLHNYVTLRGRYRYSANKNYETELKNVYNQILAKTDIKRLQTEICSL